MPILRNRTPRRRGARREWARRQLRRIAILPSLMTLANGVCGLAAIHQVTSWATAVQAGAEPTVWDGFALAGIFILLGMLADSLDGRIARFTRQTTDFGGQLDSLCDVVSFGVAPAIISYHLVLDLSATAQVGADGRRLLGEFAWITAAGYFSCAALRLARFNVENVHDESAHLWFKGLPSPGAAAAVAAMLLLRHALRVSGAPLWAYEVLAAAVPVVTLSLGLLMVSRYRYPHLVNQYLSRRQSFGYLARFVLFGTVMLAFIILTRVEYVLTAMVMFYVYSGAAIGFARQVRGLPPVPPPAAPAAAQSAGAAAAGEIPTTPPVPARSDDGPPAAV